MSISPGRTALYRVFDGTGILLYIGISSNPDVRMGQHSQTKPWWGDVASREVEWFDTRTEAQSAEREAIMRERPAWNSKLSTPRPTNSDTEELFEEFRQASETCRALLPAVRAAAVEEMRCGRTVGQLARLTGLMDEVFRRLGREHGIDRKRPPTVGREALRPEGD